MCMYKRMHFMGFIFVISWLSKKSTKIGLLENFPTYSKHKSKEMTTIINAPLRLTSVTVFSWLTDLSQSALLRWWEEGKGARALLWWSFGMSDKDWLSCRWSPKDWCSVKCVSVCVCICVYTCVCAHVWVCVHMHVQHNLTYYINVAPDAHNALCMPPTQ